MGQIIFGGIMAFLVTLLVIPVIIVIAKKKKLYDEPDDKRKLHKQPIPSFGGLAIFIGFILSLLLSVNFSVDAPEFQYYIVGFLLIFFLGIKDDIMIISPAKKFMGQVLAAVILVYKAKLSITNMDGFIGFYEINPQFSFLLSVLAIVGIINAFNLIDGVDGLAGGLGLISSLVFGIFFVINGNLPYAILAFCFASSLMAFLYYNFHPAKIFMGDTGSLLVGLVSSILVIKFISTGSSNVIPYPVASAPAVGFAILLLPLMDTLRVFSMRVINGRSPFNPDRTHFHHLLLNHGLSPKAVTLVCISAAIIISVSAFYFQGLGTTFMLCAMSCLFFGIVYLLNYKKTKYKLRVIKGVEANYSKPEIRLVPFFEKKAAVVEED
jgi:UDP-N-acetylmuramyl pentapeptide phosphotransferase/UDP-N-acetylglucosamine-1-phosphate transferase